MKTDNLEATAALFYQGEKAIQVNKTKTIWVGNNWQNKMIRFISRCQKPAPLCVNWYWHSETLRLDAPAKKHVRKKEVNADQQDQLSCKSFYQILLHEIAAEQINK